jgi:hypothetical protein
MKTLLILLLIPSLAFSQTKEIAQEHLQNLKNGALFVRLPTSQYKIKALLDRGKNKQANQVARKQHLENMGLHTAFRGAYNYSKVYFFYNLSSEAIMRGDFKGHLLNERLEPDPEIDYMGDYYIAEFDVIETTGLSALVIKNKNFERMEKPFPYYSKKYGILPVVQRNRVDIVKDLNKSLHKNYKP